MLWSTGGTLAGADTLTAAEYRARLSQARALVVDALAASGTTREGRASAARELLLRTDRVVIAGASMDVDDAGIARALGGTDEQLRRALSLLDAQIELAARAGRGPAVDPAVSDEQLRQAFARSNARLESSSLLELVALAIASFIARLPGGYLDWQRVLPLAAALGLVIIVFIVVTVTRGTGRRIRAEVLARAVAGERPSDPAEHLRAADTALAASRPRDAIRSLYLYVVEILARNGVIRYDAAMTDQELLAGAATIPEAGALRELVVAYERAWFGFHVPSADDARRVRHLADRIAS